MRRDSIAADEREVFEVGGRFRLIAVYCILKLYRAWIIVWHAKPEHKRLTRIGAPLAFFGWQFAHPGIEQPGGFAMRPLFPALSGGGKSRTHHTLFSSPSTHL